MRECLDEGVLQSYFDGELSTDVVKGVTSHLAHCLPCSVIARRVQGESDLLQTALAPEFELAVPSERLRQRIGSAVAELLSEAPEKRQNPVLQRTNGWFHSLSNVLTFTRQRALAYGGLIVVLAFAALFVMVRLRHWRSVAPASEVAAVRTPGDHPSSNAPELNPPVELKTAPTVGPGSFRPKAVMKADRSSRTQNPAGVPVKLLPGERSYLKTIAVLDSSIKSGSRPMAPALQAEYERNLAVVDRALAATRTAAKNNPNDPDAAEFMFAAYQSKVDLLNTVADARLYNRER